MRDCLTVATAFAWFLIRTTRTPRQIMGTLVWIALLASLNEAVAQRPIEDTSANSWFLGCKACVEGRMNDARLVGIGNFCSGVIHALAYVGEALPPAVQYCAPPTSTAQQLARVVLTYIEARPQRMHEDFRLLVIEALHDSWPCNSRG
jgi:hypothetical protein